MPQLSYMVNEDWANENTTLVEQSTVIREWLGEPPYVFAVTNADHFTSDPQHRPADFQFARHIAPEASTRKKLNIRDLANLKRDQKAFDHPITVVYPRADRDLDALDEAIKNDVLDKVFVMVWSPHDAVHAWLDGHGAINLHTGSTPEPLDPALLEAGQMIVREEYNGLSTGNGKAAVVQLVRAFTKAGYPLDEHMWLRAFFAAGGTFRHADQITTLIREMQSGITHRIRNRYGSV